MTPQRPLFGGDFLGQILAVDSLPTIPKGSKRCFPNGVFQIPHLGTRQRKTHQRNKECMKTPMFSSVLVPSALADPDRPLNAPL